MTSAAALLKCPGACLVEALAKAGVTTYSVSNAAFFDINGRASRLYKREWGARPSSVATFGVSPNSPCNANASNPFATAGKGRQRQARTGKGNADRRGVGT